MPELVRQDQSSGRSRRRPREPSPDSVIFTPESNISLFSSASASVERCSFASDAHDRDSLTADIPLNLGNHFCNQEESSSGQVPHPNKVATAQNHSFSSRKEHKGKVREECKDRNTEVETNPLDAARNSFSVALKEYQRRKPTSEAPAEKLVRQRPDSLDLNKAISSSPRLESMKKSLAPIKKSGVYPSPGTPTYRHAGVGMPEGWSSERIPANSDGGRRHSATLLPYSNDRILPSKWEDAERWILSPGERESILRTSAGAAYQRRPKSKSGPLGPPGLACYSLYSPAIRTIEQRNIGSFVDCSPFSAGIMLSDGLGTLGSHGAAFPIKADASMARSVSIHGYSESCTPQLYPSQDRKTSGSKDAATNISPDVSRRDMATQMSPDSSANLSPERKPSFSSSLSSILANEEPQTFRSSKMEAQDLQVDESVNTSGWFKKYRARAHQDSGVVDDWSRGREIQASARDFSESAKGISRIKREEAKITAWENLQKAKAEAAIRKLEIKLEKKRTSSMNKIIKKLKSAQERAQEMRSSLFSDQASQLSGTSQSTLSLSRTRWVSSWSACFACRAL